MTENNKVTFYKELGSAISNARKLRKLSQEFLAEKVGMSRASIVNIEKGRQFPPIHLVWQIAEILGINFSELIPNKDFASSDLNPSISKIISKKEKQGLLNNNSSAYLKSFLTKQLG
ncbi:helix-turn-helix domain-containing protein [Salegentibacter sp. JZCK2]|uniref:helix-turn-helix domain-containing protein n=1 Tax=Salegentibacter tibetensis TaxID=2873600 RepID=UPI001CCD88C6|nr:helix-turn-helix transcriptional regulator [Salegentibacter tibetensis]MBZ9731185.1 helix-turn-helix domain-containing protein [Salegentibacter tibetensis]